MQTLETVHSSDLQATVWRDHAVSPRLSARWVSIDELTARQDDWNRLSELSVWRNAALEPNYLLPAVQHLANANVRVLIVEINDHDRENQLAGLLPIEQKTIFRLPFKTAEIWKHEQCFDATPLLDRELAVDVWQTVCTTLRSEGYALFSLDTVVASSQMERVFRACEKKLGVARFQRDDFQRAAFIPDQNFETYTQQNVSKSIRRNTNRLMRRLEEQGTVTWEASSAASDFRQLAEDFLKIEASGWKGNEGTALLANDDTCEFYRQLIRDSAAVGKARFLSLKLDGRPIAMLSDIQTGKFVYSYKTAYDDAFAAYSPGQQIEVKNIELLHRDGIRLGDSCTSSDNSTINRIWGQKLDFQSLLLSLSPGIARTAVKALPFVQSAVRQLRNNS